MATYSGDSDSGKQRREKYGPDRKMIYVVMLDWSPNLEDDRHLWAYDAREVIQKGKRIRDLSTAGIPATLNN